MTEKVKINTTEANNLLAYRQASRAMCRAPSGTIWVLYVDSNGITGDILIAYSEDGGSTWTEEIAVASARCYGYRALALVVDSSSVPHIIYHYDPALGDDEIRYVNRVGGTWGTPETVYTVAGGNFQDIAACIDSGNNIHIAFDDLNANEVEYVTGTSGSWGSMETVESRDNSGNGVSIAVNSKGEPYVVYTGPAAFPHFLMNYRTGGVWQTPVQVETEGTTSFWGSIAIDSKDDLHVIYVDTIAGTYKIFYRKQQSGIWQDEVTIVTDTTGDDYSAPILILDNADNVYVVYQHGRLASDETIYYKKITSGTLGSEQTLDDAILQPSGYPSTYSGLWHKYPSSGILPQSFHPIVVLLHETALGNADLYFEAEKFVLKAIKGNPNIDQRIYQHVERMGR